MNGFFERLKELLFGKPESVQKPIILPPAKAKVTTKRTPERPARKEPFFVQVGLDFGTAFSKCVWRDVNLEKAWVYLPRKPADRTLPFLQSSLILHQNGVLKPAGGSPGEYVEGGLYHIKLALEKVGAEEWNDAALQPFRGAIQSSQPLLLAPFVEQCAVYLLSGILGEVRQEIRKRYPGCVEGDYMAVNMAVPVADANHSHIEARFDRVLRLAWLLADELAGHPPTSCIELQKMIESKGFDAEEDRVKGVCYIYPEVSANVQGFVRSRTSQEGLYLFSDTGAGTVDQSVFILARPNGSDRLSYLHAAVLPLGSSHLEQLAAEAEGDLRWCNLEAWRKRKESGEDHAALRSARERIGQRLAIGTEGTIRLAKNKLIRKEQMNSLRVIFGGGGHCENPYRSRVLSQFEEGMFHPAIIKERRKRGEPFDLGMPMPNDLELDGRPPNWLDRLTVAYGLSFERGDLAPFVLPRDIESPNPDKLWKPKRPRPEPPSKDEC